VMPKPRTKAAAEMESELKLLAAASVTPIWAISRVRAEQRPPCCPSRERKQRLRWRASWSRWWPRA
jgi:hypothetical protein